MDKRVIMILVLVVVIVAGIGGALILLSKPSTPPAQTTPTPIATPITQTTSEATLTASVSTPLATGSEGLIDIFVDTKSTKVDGFQFIATLGGTATPTILDADPVVDGKQILAAAVPGLSISTNSVTTLDSGETIRFAMVASDATAGFLTTTPTKVASLRVSSGTSGSVTLTFNAQNSRIRPSSGGDDLLMISTDASFPVSTSAIGETSASGSGQLTSVSTTPVPVLTQSTPLPQSASPFCLASCFTDSDCAAGFTCQADRCVNPACPTSQTCGCGIQEAAAVPTQAPLALVTPKPTLIAATVPTPAPEVPLPTEAPVEELPQSGVFEYTLLLIGAGLLFIGGGVYLSYAGVHSEL